MPLFQNARTKIYYETLGEATHPAVVFVMGITGQLVFWPKPWLQAITDAGYYVIIFDNRDVGLSQYYDHIETPELSAVIANMQRGESVTPPYTLQDMADDIVTLLDGLQIEKAHIVGISMGGIIAQYFALLHRERLHTITLMMTSPGDPDLCPPRPEVMNYFLQPKPQDVSLDWHIEQHLQQYRLYNHPDDYDEKATIALFHESYNRAFHPEGNTRQLLALMAAPPRGEALRTLDCPCLIIHGEIDPVFPLDHAKRLNQCISGSQLEIFDRLGHGLPVRLHDQLQNSLCQHFIKS